MSATPLDSAAIQRLVAEVIARLGSGEAALPATPVAASPAPPSPAAASLADKVITLASLERLPAGTRTVAIAATAVVTPSAREYAADNRISFDRRAADAAATAAVRSLLVARVDARDAAGRAAAITRAVPAAAQLPATGLADAIAALVTHAARDGGRGILLSGRPAVAVILANRQSGLRAVTGRDVAGLLAAAAEAAANLLVVDPAGFSAGSLERVAVEFAKRDFAPVPAELVAAAKPCACSGHTH